MKMDMRQSAEERIEKGIPPVTRGSAIGIEALTLLHGLASAPQSASDAAKLLHELKVHQVELDLQHEQAELDRRQLTEDLADYTALFDLAPVAYLTLEPEGLVIAANRIAADWLAPETSEREVLAGRRIQDVLAPECRAAVRDMLAALRKGEGRQTCAVRSRFGGASALVVATATPGVERVLMAFVPEAPVPGH